MIEAARILTWRWGCRPCRQSARGSRMSARICELQTQVKVVGQGTTRGLPHWRNRGSSVPDGRQESSARRLQSHTVAVSYASRFRRRERKILRECLARVTGQAAAAAAGSFALMCVSCNVRLCTLLLPHRVVAVSRKGLVLRKRLKDRLRSGPCPSNFRARQLMTLLGTFRLHACIC